MQMKERIIEPKVDQIWEIKEIANDFMNPLEIFREAISNSYDAEATKIDIEVYMDEKNEYDNFTIKISDNGKGMTAEQLNNFWSLGYSEKRGNGNEKIGAKGHGTTIYLKAKYIQVRTTSSDGAYESICIDPYQNLRNGKMHRPTIREISKFANTGTEIILQGYIKEESDQKYFQHEVIKDYILWFTKHGSFEKELGIDKYNDCVINLKAFGHEKEEISFGHVFPKENTDIDQLKKEYNGCACDYFVQKFVKKAEELKNFPNYKYDLVVYVEGTGIKKSYNPMISDNKKKITPCSYKIADRYGIYLCKDYIPIQRKNEWINSFGTGSNSFGLLHAFVNCQNFDLTANRGSISIKNQKVMEDLENAIAEELQNIQKEIYKSQKGLDVLNSYRDEVKTKDMEEHEFENRKQRIKQKNVYKHQNLVIYEPMNEAELYYAYTVLNTLYPDEFEFEALDYNASTGIDMIVKGKGKDTKYSEYRYVELKHILSAKEFNHSFKNLSYILCWDIDDNIKQGQKFSSKVDGDEWTFKVAGNKIFLDNDTYRNKIEIIKLKDIFYKKIDKEKDKIEV